MVDHFLFLVATPGLFDDDAVLAHFEEASFDLRTVLEDDFHQAADILFVLAVQFQRFIQARGGDFQRKIVGRNEARFFQLLVQCPVDLHTFFDGDALITIDEHLDIVDGFDPDVHQEILRFAG